MKIFRWKYIVPRLTFLLLLMTALRFGLDPALRYAIVVSGESSLGAKVELQEVSTSITDGQIVLRNFAVTNPTSPLRNLVETQDTTLQLDMNALLHKRLVVENGSITGIQFDSDRTTSGELVVTPEDPDAGPSFLDPWADSISQFGDQWLEQINERLNQNLVDQLESPKVAKELEERWPQEYTAIRAQIDSLRDQSKTLEKQFRELRKNPLRNLEGIGQLQTQLATTESQLHTLQAKLNALPQQVESDRQAILAARERDEQLIRSQLQFQQIDGDGLTQMLLGEATNQGLATAVDWIAWARGKIPSKREALPDSRSRGTNVLYGPKKPKHWIKQLQLAGQAQLSGTPLQLVGKLTDASSDPHLVAEPTRLSLHSNEGQSLAIDVTLDRRTEIATDHLQLACPSLNLPGQEIGSADKLAIQLAPTTASFHADLTITDEQLAGKIIFHQPTAEMTIATQSAKHKKLVAVLGKAVENVQQIEARVDVAGTLKKPDVQLESDLGSQLAEGINRGVQQYLTEKSETLLASTRAKVDAQINRLAEAREKAQQELLAKLGKHQELIGQLAALNKGGTGLPIPKISSLKFGNKRN